MPKAKFSVLPVPLAKISRIPISNLTRKPRERERLRPSRSILMWIQCELQLFRDNTWLPQKLCRASSKHGSLYRWDIKWKIDSCKLKKKYPYYWENYYKIIVLCFTEFKQAICSHRSCKQRRTDLSSQPTYMRSLPSTTPLTLHLSLTIWHIVSANGLIT